MVVEPEEKQLEFAWGAGFQPEAIGGSSISSDDIAGVTPFLFGSYLCTFHSLSQGKRRLCYPELKAVVRLPFG